MKIKNKGELIMMKKCIVCSSEEIIPDLRVFTQIGSDDETIYVALDPPKKAKGTPVEIGFRAAICGSCGHVELYVRYAEELLGAYKKGYASPK